jgi:hypothetical protein
VDVAIHRVFARAQNRALHRESRVQHETQSSGRTGAGVGPVSGSDQLVYTDVRGAIRTGDIFLFQGQSAISRLIRWGSESDYSHAGFAAWWDGRLMVFQASGRGAEVLPVSSAVDAYDGQVDWFALGEQHRTRVDTDILLTDALTLLGRSYAKLGLVELMVRMARGRFRGRADVKDCPDSVFCSQYVSYCYRRAGLDLVADTDDGSTSPGDLARSPLLERRGVLHANPQEKAARREAALPGQPRGQLKK